MRTKGEPWLMVRRVLPDKAPVLGRVFEGVRYGVDEGKSFDPRPARREGVIEGNSIIVLY